MENIRLPEELLPKNMNLKKPAAFIAEKDPSLPDYGIHTGDLVIVEQESEFTEGELSVFSAITWIKPSIVSQINIFAMIISILER